jgi:hypothetical protein
MTDRRRQTASPRQYEICGSVIHPADQRWLDTVRLHLVDRETGRSLIARKARSRQGPTPPPAWRGRRRRGLRATGDRCRTRRGGGGR